MTSTMELLRPYSTLKVFTCTVASCTVSGLGTRLSTPGVMLLVMSSPSTTNMLPTLLRPLALAVTCVSAA